MLPMWSVPPQVIRHQRFEEQSLSAIITTSEHGHECPHIYKSAGCGYVGESLLCDKTKESCIEHGLNASWVMIDHHLKMDNEGTLIQKRIAG